LAFVPALKNRTLPAGSPDANQAFQGSIPEVIFKDGTAIYWALEWNGTPEKAHNMVLQIAATMGILGLTAFFWMLAGWLVSLWRLLRGEGDTSRRMLAFGGFIAVVTFIVQNLFSFTVVGYGSLFWMLMGLAPAMERTWRGADAPAPAAAPEPAPVRPVHPLALPGLVLLAVLMGLFAVHSTRIWVADSFYKQGQIGMRIDGGRSKYSKLLSITNEFRRAAGGTNNDMRICHDDVV